MGGVSSSEMDSVLDRKLKLIHDKLDSHAAAISGLSSGGGSCDLTDVNNTLGSINSNILDGINGLNNNITDSYYYITEQNQNISLGLIGMPGSVDRNPFDGSSPSDHFTKAAMSGDAALDGDGPRELIGLCESTSSNNIHRPINAIDKQCNWQGR